MHENSRNEKVRGEIGRKTKETERINFKKYRGTQRQNRKEKVKEQKRQTAEEERGKQRMQMRGESVTEMIAAITIIISCWQ